jgi:KaiC/GvpD/RAD55 family RecA-like ATPase
VFALAEDGMNAPNALTTMEQIFDGVIEMRRYEQGLSITPLLRVKKMLGLPPLHGYFRFSVSSTGTCYERESVESGWLLFDNSDA